MDVEQCPTSTAISMIRGALDALTGVDRGGLSAEARLGLVESARREHDRLGALVGVLLAEADAVGASLVARGTPTTSWLGLSGATSAKEAAALVFTARDLASCEQVREAALAGQVQVGQARGIVKALDTLPVTLTAEQRREAERRLIGQARTHNAHSLALLGPEVLAVVAPELAPTPDDHLAALDVQYRRAHARRSLSFTPDGDGSILFRGCLPHSAAAPFVKLIDAYVESDRRASRDHTKDRDVGCDHADGHAERSNLAERDATGRSDRLAGYRTPDQRRADALLALVAAHQRARRAPRVAGDRPRIVVNMREADLRERAEQAGLLASGGQISAGELRRVCCDADRTPVVLGTASELRDVGRTTRLVTPALRRALSVRDRGCVFPHCDAADERCDAHHVQPWWDGGTTSLGNLVLACPYHHSLIEPARFWTGIPPDQWQIRFNTHGLPEVIPPARLDPTRTPLPTKARAR